MSLTFEIFKYLRKNQHTLSVAESCTGGGLSYDITKLPGVSKIFLGGITCYSNEAKEKLLHIPHELLLEKGAVSEEVATVMAENCRELFGSTWALATTGIAGPTGGSLEKPVGLLWIGLAGPKIVTTKRFLFANASRIAYQQMAINHALELLMHYCANE